MDNHEINKEIEKKYNLKRIGMYAEHYVGCFRDGLVWGIFWMLVLNPLIKRGGVARGIGYTLYTIVSIPYIICSAEYKTSFLEERKRILEIQEQNEYYV